MKDMSFIKRCCEYAEGFSVDGDLIVLPDESLYSTDWCWLLWSTVLMPLMIYRTIEGVEKELGVRLCIYKDEGSFYFSWGNHGDAGGSDYESTKIIALEYIFDYIERGRKL